ncbi:hypothetical protein [uncultured Flavobacterium sp.]|uniref:hypothetical protein n=1 Tax=uncultured Flavobacterium sp. TaxID=165435 RepID=UPI0025F484DC|nr:hypothetical protein [uncultured Flavobacterium sp.]
MEFPITEKFRKFQSDVEGNANFIKAVNIEKDDADYLNRIAQDAIDDFARLGYEKIEERYLDILNIDTFHFHRWLEIDGYTSHIEFNIEKVYSNLSLIDYDEKLWFDGQSEEDKALWKTFRSFDTRPEIGDGKMAVFSIQEGVSPPNEPAIYYIDRASCWKTNLTFVQYYEAVLDMMGIADWQLLFTDVSLKDPMISYKYNGLKKSLEALAKAFPDKDYSKYFELLEARWV